MKTYLRLFRGNRNFALFFAGQATSRFGDSLYTLAIIWYLVSNIDSPFVFSLVLLLQKLPEVILSPFLGMLGDKFSRRNLLILMDCLSVVVYVFLLFAMGTKASPFVIAGILFLEGAIQSMWIPLYFSFIPDVASKEEIKEANVALNFADNFSYFAGPALAGFLLMYISVQGIVMINMLTFVFSAICLTRIRMPKKLIHEISNVSQGVMVSLKEGLKYLLSMRELRLVLGMYAIGNFLLEAYFVFLPIYLKQHVMNKPILLGLFESFLCGGMLVGTAVFAAMRPKTKKIILISASELLTGITIILVMLLLKFNLWMIALAFVAPLGAFLSFEQVNVDLLYQELVDDKMRSRLMGIRVMIARSLTPFSKAINGYISSFAGVFSVILGNGILLAAMGVYCFRVCRQSGDEAKRLQHANWNRSGQI